MVSVPIPEGQYEEIVKLYQAGSSSNVNITRIFQNIVQKKI